MPSAPPNHRPAHWQSRSERDTRRGSAHARGYGRAWERLRAAVLAEEPLCRECQAAGRVEAATDVDHVKPRARGGTDARSNLQPLCHECHSAKTAREDGGFGRGAPARGGAPSGQRGKGV